MVDNDCETAAAEGECNSSDDEGCTPDAQDDDTTSVRSLNMSTASVASSEEACSRPPKRLRISQPKSQSNLDVVGSSMDIIYLWPHPTSEGPPPPPLRFPHALIRLIRTSL